jgi:hypothetical protein
MLNHDGGSGSTACPKVSRIQASGFQQPMASASCAWSLIKLARRYMLESRACRQNFLRLTNALKACCPSRHCADLCDRQAHRRRLHTCGLCRDQNHVGRSSSVPRERRGRAAQHSCGWWHLNRQSNTRQCATCGSVNWTCSQLIPHAVLIQTDCRRIKFAANLSNLNGEYLPLPSVCSG